MITDIINNQHMVCIIVLGVLIASLAVRRHQSHEVGFLISSCILLLFCHAEVISGMLFQVEDDYALKGFHYVLSLVLLIGSLVLLLCAFLYPGIGVKRRHHSFPWSAFLVTLLPLWLSGLYVSFTRYYAELPVGMALSLLIATSAYYRFEEQGLEEKARWVEAQQARSLQEQMRPHFLFNVLAAIDQLMVDDPVRARGALENLSGYLRMNLDSFGAEKPIPFTKELEYIEEYVSLEKLCSNKEFEVVYDLAIVDFCVPPLSVQPLVENGIRHGFPPGMKDGLLIVSTQKQGDMVRVVVEDNGTPSEGTVVQQKTNVSLGLSNVRERLETQCDGSLYFHSEENGTRVVILLPLLPT